jgi:SAM-dependent methyltransferase
MIGNRFEYDAMAQCERDLWWFKCLHELTVQKILKYSPVMDPVILDAGCGTGGLIQHLKKEGFTKIRGFDLSPDAIEYARKASAEVQLLDILKTDVAFPENSFDVVICNDIFTVLQPGKDREAMEKLVSVLKPGGILIINLAALPSFAGIHDIAVKMTKRYTRACIDELVQNLVIVKEITFWPFLLSPVILGIRSYQRLKLFFNKQTRIKSDVRPVSPILNNIFYKITKLENKTQLSKPLGSSIFVVMEKPKEITLKAFKSGALQQAF